MHKNQPLRLTDVHESHSFSVPGSKGTGMTVGFMRISTRTELLPHFLLYYIGNLFTCQEMIRPGS